MATPPMGHFVLSRSSRPDQCPASGTKNAPLRPRMSAESASGPKPGCRKSRTSVYNRWIGLLRALASRYENDNPDLPKFAESPENGIRDQVGYNAARSVPRSLASIESGGGGVPRHNSRPSASITISVRTGDPCSEECGSATDSCAGQTSGAAPSPRRQHEYH
jgi:hypothetical protein